MGRKNKPSSSSSSSKKVSKAGERKKERLANERLMNERLQFVKAANAQEDPLGALPSFKAYNKNGLSVSLTTERVTALSKDTKEWLVELIVKYLIARDSASGDPLGFSHFRYDMDCDDEVLYVYEIQLEGKVRRKGLGRFMMQVLELLAFKSDMRKIMLTVFKHNEAGRRFFLDRLGYETDETSPDDDVHQQFDYAIVSKFNKRKIAMEKKREEEEIRARLAMMQMQQIAGGGGGCCAKKSCC